MSIYIWVSIALIFFIIIGIMGGYIAYKDIRCPKEPIELKLNISDYIGMSIALFMGLMFLGWGIISILLMFVTILNIDNLQKTFSLSDIPLFVLGIICLIFSIHVIKFLRKILLCDCKSIKTGNNSQLLIIKLKNSSLIELPFNEIREINIKHKALIARITFDFIEIYTKSGEFYNITVGSAINFYNSLPENIKKSYDF